MSPTEPLDDTLTMSIRARDMIRRHVADLREQINRWEPAPYYIDHTDEGTEHWA